MTRRVPIVVSRPSPSPGLFRSPSPSLVAPHAAMEALPLHEQALGDSGGNKLFF